MKFGFITSSKSIELRRYATMLAACNESSIAPQIDSQKIASGNKSLVPLMQIPAITSATGVECEGVITYLPENEQGKQGDTDEKQTLVDGIDELSAIGVDVIGLGGVEQTPDNIVFASQSGVPISYGCRLTVFACYKNVIQIANWLEALPQQETIAIVGLPRDMSLALGQLLLEHGFKLLLQESDIEGDQGNTLADITSKYPDQIQLISTTEDCYHRSRIIVGSSSHDEAIDIDHMQPGTIFVDIALRFDAHPATSANRGDIVVVDGGCVSASERIRLGTQPFGAAVNQPLTGAMAEVMILSFEGRQDLLSTPVPPDIHTVLDIGEIAERHGFTVEPISRDGERIDELAVKKLQCHYQKDGKAERSSLDFVEQVIRDQPSREKTLARHHRYINPVMVDFLAQQQCDNVFIRAKGTHLSDHQGREFLDMVAGYGCLSLGHNPQPVIDAVTEYLSQQGPNFVQYISIAERPAKLAEVLCHIAPGNLERVFFSNSGTEAVEAAIKVVKAATGNPTIAYLKNSYHGKTMGALSVTGREKHRAHFQPLLSHTIEVPFGDLDALEATLRGHDVGAFILEPIQGEGGVQVPPAGYLKGVQALCRATDTLLMVDEIQTAFGRTGRLFACDWEDVEPDVLILSKSLSGGVMPIGATLCTSEVWDRAYGSLERFLHHTSTFGGGNLASVAALAAVREVLAQDIPRHADELGTYFKQALQEVASQYAFISEVRGKGLLLGVQFNDKVSQADQRSIQESSERFSHELNASMHLLPEDVRLQLQGAVQGGELSIAEMLCLSFVTRICVDHQILTFFTANSYTVVRVQPPLVVTKAEVDRFVDAFRTVCEYLSRTFY